MTTRQVVKRDDVVKELNIFSQYVLVDVRLSRWWGEVKMSDEFVKEHDLSPESARIVSDLIDKDSDVWKDMMEVRKEMRRAVNRYSVPSPFRGYTLVYKDRVRYIYDKYVELKEIFEPIFQALLNKYEEEVEKFAKKHPKIYKATKDKYPSREGLARKFRFEIAFRAIRVPDQSVLDPEIRKFEVEQFRRDVRETKNRTMVYIRDQVLKRLGKISDGFEDGVPNSRTIGSVNNLLDKIDSAFAGLIDSEGLKQILNEVRKEIGETDVGLMKDDVKYQEQLKKKVKAITKSIKKLSDKGELALEI